MNTVNGDGNIAFDRLGRELSGYYLIGFEPTDADRTGKERRIKVSVKPRGLTVRARPTFVIRRRRDATANRVADADAAARRSPEVAAAHARTADARRHLLLRRQRQQGAGRDHSRRSAIRRPRRPSGRSASIILDKNEKIVINRGGMSTLAPASEGGESPRLMLSSLTLDPGEYTLRVAAVDDTGRGGSAHHSINARLNTHQRRHQRLRSDARPAAANRRRAAAAAAVHRDRQRNGVGDARADRLRSDPARPRQGDAADLRRGKRQRARQRRSADRRRAATCARLRRTMRLGVLPPGEYIARALINVAGPPEMRLTRPFMLSPVAMAAAEPPPDLGVPLDPDAPPAPVAPSRIIAPVPRFSAHTILTPAVVQPFLDGLADMHPPSPEVEAVIEKARTGNYDAPPIAARRRTTN